MEKEQRTRLQKATQDARRLLEEEFAGQLLQTYDINVSAGRWSDEPGAHLQAEERLIREKLVAWIEHKEAQINDRKEALLLALREMAFTALNRFVALKLMEARELVRPCVSGGLESEGFQEFTAVAQGLLADQEGAYRLYLETIFEDVSRELRALFDPRDPASLLWPKRTALLELLDILNRPELAELWREDETLGWIYQYFNGDAERKKMREESSAPRNSRELAVRNQFFTPRYVVEFLTDNTLGRIWYEMRQGDTGLKERCRYLVRRPNEIWLQPGEEAPAEVVADEALSQEELLRQLVHIPYRPLKDPREIRMLDPACGSMHFGLYAFDLYLAIYEEAWEIAQGSDEQAKQGEVFAAFVAYAADFASKADFLREVPRLILLHNIHGVDIDPRATQIARLTLWLRAQRAWQEQKVEVAARPAISRSNVVCAEPMPGEKVLLADFVDQQFPEAERGLVQQLLETIFDKMQLAGEAGSLLKIEEEIRDAIEQARREWQKLAIQQRDLFSAAELVELGGVGSALNTDLQNLTRDFWVGIEERIYAALRDYAEQAEGGSGFQRRLFAEDAARGFAFIDVCRKRYDVALMNPPFGEWSLQYKSEAKGAYPDSYNDVLAAFVDRGGLMLCELGLIGAITSRACFFTTSFTKWRENVVLGSLSPALLADLGMGVMDAAMVEAAAYVLERTKGCKSDCLICFRLIGNEDPSTILPLACSSLRSLGTSEFIYKVAPSTFSLVPRSPFAYWVPERMRAAFQRFSPLENHGRDVQSGASTMDDFRFLRLWWEIPSHFRAGSRVATEKGKRWVTIAKGGPFSRYHIDWELVIDWKNDGASLKSHVSEYRGKKGWGYHWAAAINGHSEYFRPGLTWPRRTQGGLSIRTLPQGAIFGDKGPAIFVPNNDKDELWALLAITNSQSFRDFISLQMAFGSYEVGVLERTPIPDLSEATLVTLRDLGRQAWSSASSRDKRDLVTHSFASLPLSKGTRRLSQIIDAWKETERHRLKKTSEIQIEVDSLCRNLYRLAEEDSPENLGSVVVAAEPSELEGDNEECDAQIDNFSRTRNDDIASTIIDYLLGAIAGRWDIRFAINERNPTERVDPFDPLPVCPPGMLLDADGLPVEPKDVPSDYPVYISWSGIFVDDESCSEDIVFRVRQVLGVIWTSSAEGIEREACEILGVPTLRDYFRRSTAFFADHLSRHSKSRRQAPIYWQLSAGNGNYSAWLYYHRFTQDTLYRVLGDFVEIRIQEAEREQFEFESQGGLSGDAASLLQEAQTLLQDLRLFKSELELVAPLWNPNLNDGVIINHAILWRITPYSPWQKKCKECWDKLVRGDYDWSHLAFHLWPERVIRKCTTDRSLAIAHGLEERLWQETSKGNWLQRQVSDAELQALLAEYSKPAVQNALERFLAAAPPVAATRTRAPRASQSSSTGTTRRPRGPAPEVDAETSRQTLLVLTAAPAEGLGRNAIAELLGVEAASLTAVIKQLKEGGQIEQLGAARGAKYRLSESGFAAVESQAGEEE
jgi:hypothetical protein